MACWDWADFWRWRSGCGGELCKRRGAGRPRTVNSGDTVRTFALRHTIGTNLFLKTRPGFSFIAVEATHEDQRSAMITNEGFQNRRHPPTRGLSTGGRWVSILYSTLKGFLKFLWMGFQPTLALQYTVGHPSKAHVSWYLPKYWHWPYAQSDKKYDVQTS